MVLSLIEGKLPMNPGSLSLSLDGSKNNSLVQGTSVWLTSLVPNYGFSTQMNDNKSTLISWVSDQNGVYLLYVYIMLEIHHSGRESSIFSCIPKLLQYPEKNFPSSFSFFFLVGLVVCRLLGCLLFCLALFSMSHCHHAQKTCWSGKTWWCIFSGIQKTPYGYNYPHFWSSDNHTLSSRYKTTTISILLFSPVVEHLYC